MIDRIIKLQNGADVGKKIVIFLLLRIYGRVLILF